MIDLLGRLFGDDSESRLNFSQLLLPKADSRRTSGDDVVDPTDGIAGRGGNGVQ